MGIKLEINLDHSELDVSDVVDIVELPELCDLLEFEWKWKELGCGGSVWGEKKLLLFVGSGLYPMGVQLRLNCAWKASAS